ncbi:hypothetical protein DPEC_G00112910 [Dallia pectoralis]|uniref:Uncharacterized protein n=1 Tax=Dallia pectoralis TaxID=75939 RepID=A0ACC2GTB4_DALPE|nr:hypothetical protein DPEC_G00112910 [Dallia pectoralis]
MRKLSSRRERASMEPLSTRDLELEGKFQMLRLDKEGQIFSHCVSIATTWRATANMTKLIETGRDGLENEKVTGKRKVPHEKMARMRGEEGKEV